jgi:hypothetical protein
MDQMAFAGSVAGILGLVVATFGIWLAVRHHKRSVALLETICTGLRHMAGGPPPQTERSPARD